MKIKKGDVYKEKRGTFWLKITRIKKDSHSGVFVYIKNRGVHRYSEIGLRYFIMSNKLIKIPQLYK